MRAIVTGSTGIVGSYIVRELIDNTSGVEQVVALSRRNRFKYEDHPGRSSAILLDCWGDLLCSPVRLITQFSPSHIFHCAGEGRQNAPTNDIWRANVDTTLNLLEACKTLKEKVKFVYCSSIVVDHKPMNVYAASKLAGEHLVESYRGYVLGQSVRFPAVAGAGNKHGVVKAVVDKLLDKSTDILSLYTNSRKPIIYAGDLANSMVKMAEKPYYGRYQLCPRDSIYVEHIAKIAMDLCGIYKKIEWGGNKLEDKNDIVFPVKSSTFVNWSEDAVRLAIKDILREEYGIQ